MRDGKRVVYVEVGQVGKGRRKAWIAPPLARLEAHVLDHQHLARRNVLDQFVHVRTDHRRCHRHGNAGQLLQSRGDGSHRQPAVPTVWVVQVRHEHDAGPPAPELVDRWQGGA